MSIIRKSSHTNRELSLSLLFSIEVKHKSGKRSIFLFEVVCWKKMEDLTSELQRLLVKLDDPNKIERKKSLEKLKSFVELKFPKIEIDDENRSADALSLWQDRLCRPLIRSIGSDSSERVREISAEIVFYLLDRFPSYGTETSSGSDYMKMAYLFPLLQSRLVNISSNLNSIRIFKSKLAKDLKIYFH